MQMLTSLVLLVMGRYMKEQTTKHVDIIDPTGRMFRVDPSQVTTVVDRSFGLGFNPRKDIDQMAQVLDLVQSHAVYRDPGLGEYTRLLPKVRRMVQLFFFGA